MVLLCENAVLQVYIRILLGLMEKPEPGFIRELVGSR